MSTTSRGAQPFIWPSWLAKHLAGETTCPYQVWFKAHFKYDKRPDERGFNLAAWTADHSALVMARHAELLRDGWAVHLENQNAFRVFGRAGLLSGKADLVAFRGSDILIVDAKTGTKKHSDWWQVLIYLWAYPLARRGFGLGCTVRGEVCYRSGERVTIEREELTAARVADIVRALTVCGGPRPDALPSAEECAWCDIGVGDCAARVEPVREETVTTDAF
jgi:hypothetical protein